MADADLLPELPELMLSLRSFGSRRGAPNESGALDEEQAQFFAPLLDGRRTAAQAISRCCSSAGPAVGPCKACCTGSCTREASGTRSCTSGQRGFLES